MDKLLFISVHKIKDKKMMLPGDPIAVVEAPAFLAALPEPYLISRLMKSMQVATRFTKLAKAVGWERQRLFEVGLRAANSFDDHLDSVRVLESVGLSMTSSGVASERTGIIAGGSMGHRYTQRFTSDYQAFSWAIDRMLAYKEANAVAGTVKLSLLLDTLDTLRSGLPAAVRVIKERIDVIKPHIDVSVRLDSGDMERQLIEIIRTFQRELRPYNYLPSIIVESGLTARAVSRYERIAREQGFPRNKMLYGVGGYLVGGIQRDFISLVYKVSAYGGQATMKFADERDRAKESYPGAVTLLESEQTGQVRRLVALRTESEALRQAGWREVFVDLVNNGQYIGPQQTKRERLAYIEQRWEHVGQSYTGDDKYPEDFPRKPLLSAGVAGLVERLRFQQLNFALPRLVANSN